MLKLKVQIGAMLHRISVAAVGVLLLASVARAQSTRLDEPTFVEQDELPKAIVKPLPKSSTPRGPIRGITLTHPSDSIQTTKFQSDAPSGGYENHQPPDLNSPRDRSPTPGYSERSTGGSGATLGVPRSAGIGQSSADDTREESYNWGTPGNLSTGGRNNRANDDDTPSREPRTKGKLTKAGGQERGYDDYDPNRLPSESRGGGSAPAGSDWQFGDYAKGCYDYVRKNLFESDHDFDDFMPHTSNPLYAETAQTVTDLRPIFMYQKIPSSNYFYKGGNVENFAVQGRLAFGDRFSVVINQVGWLVINKGSASTASSSTGFEEIHLGAKYTYLRDKDTAWLGAVGMNFQIPTGPGGVYQDTGSLGLQPYTSFAHKFGKGANGTWGLSDSLGVNFSVDSQRSEFFYNSFHIDYDVLNLRRYYPFVELNWFSYFRNGTARSNFGFEGSDIANVGTTINGHNYINIAVGSRFVLGPSTQLGLGVEFPLTGASKDLNNFRLTVDFVWRY